MYKFQDSGETKWMTGGAEDFVQQDTTHQIDFANLPPSLTKLNNNLKPVFDYGSTEKWGFCGFGALTKISNAASDGIRFNDKLSDSIGMEVKDFVQAAGGVIHFVPDYEMSQTNRDTEIYILDIQYLRYMYLEGEDIRVDKGKSGVGLQLPDQKKTIHQIYGTVGMKRSFADAHFHCMNLA